MNLLYLLSLSLGISAILSIILKQFKQPSVLAYIFTGIILGSFFVLSKEEKESIHFLSELGVTLLLFLLGLELRLGELKNVGKVAVITGVGQIVFTTTIGVLINLLLGFNFIASFYIAFGITFSSTIVIVKLLSDKKELNTLHGRISIGFLLVQDFFAILALVLLTSFSIGESPSFFDVISILLKAFFLFYFIIALSQTIIPWIVSKISNNHEILFISSLAWVFSIAFVVSSPFIGFSIEIGGFLAGLALSNSLESTQIVSKVKSLRDFFIVIFFVSLGAGMQFAQIIEVIFPAIVLSIFILIGNPLIVMIIMGLLGFKSRTSFMAGLTVAQISEFSIILLYLGQKLGHVGSAEVSMVTMVGIITFTISTYMILNSRNLYNSLKNFLKIFEKTTYLNNEDKYGEYSIVSHSKVNNINNKQKIFDIVLIGAHRMGQIILEQISNYKDKILVIDFNPDVVKSLGKKGFNVLFGDIADNEIQEKANLYSAKLIVSTVPDFEDNLILANYLRNRDTGCKLFVTAHDSTSAEQLKKLGVDRIIMPYAFTGKYLGRSIVNDFFS